MQGAVLLEALAQGRQARDAGKLQAAQAWFERAARMAPGDALVRLELAQLLVVRGQPGGRAIYQQVAEAADIREAWLGLAVANLRDGQLDEAAAALAHGLCGHIQTPGEIAAAADAVVQASGSLGWCALDGAGVLTVSVAGRAASPKSLSAKIDGQPITLHRQPKSRRLTGRLPKAWEKADSLSVMLGDRHLLGSPIAISRIVRVEGFVDSIDGDIHGWAWCPRDPDRNPIVTVEPIGSGPSITVAAEDDTVAVEAVRSFARPRGFRIPAARLRGVIGPVRVVGRDGRNLTGSPLDPAAERISAERSSAMVARLFPAPGQSAPAHAGQAQADQAQADQSQAGPVARLSVPARIIGGPPRGGGTRRPVDVIVPVYGGLDLTLACLGSALADLPGWARLIVVDDASPDPAVVASLGELARQGGIELLAQPDNRGFPATVNIGMRHDAKRDVVLLNSDTLVPPGWLHRLREAAYSAAEIGSVTPLSNEATILSYPSVEQPNAIPDLDETIIRDGLAQRANGAAIVEIPTAVGFCMYIKRDCLNATGLFREDVFGQGYGEENDFCIRARHLGWRHVAAPGLFVAHVGGQSFGASKAHLIKRNLRLLNSLHPGYDALVQAFQRVDPLSEFRRRMDIERWALQRDRRRSVLLITHGRGGGVQRRVAERAQALRAEGLRPIVIWPVDRRGGGGRDCVLGDGPEGGTPNLRFAVPEGVPELAALLKKDRPIRAEVHHLIGHDHALFGLFAQLKIPYQVVIHDYSWFCPRINLVGEGNRYCGEPDLAGCEACIADLGTTNDEPTRPTELVARSAAELAGAARIVVPSEDVGGRMRRHFAGIAPRVEAWENDAALPPASLSALLGGEIGICLIGALSIEKGYDVVLACARDAARRKLPIVFRLVGHSRDDDRLLATGKVHITGRYDEHEVVGLIRAQSAQLAWLSSIWPETWCYTLTHAWSAGLDTVAFDIGTPAARIRQTGRGWLVPLGMPPSTLNLQFMRMAEQAVAAHLPPGAAVAKLVAR